ncbi:LacI family DNA-binding transcriptional regulator [Mucilaginibacter myungsuensis]|uniref:LacI family DNA-binding transcriptional regulator n=1 Tax=Mucilaginibacter myungsuensis TaxID=649104 RepID=A0A929L6W4_9SPHI|nr:LacI family DNA-binding transcriptional regulator [Mucilaginibacter myungsuensis]MBE9664291.1 LacI family DNA-binding transcriptional regulator [Mucilaginibacter myungsuensis]MDN3599995.1 LacI family DNA-binding transcriptional regulator [Mucilaginibacter myungsuensis]
MKQKKRVTIYDIAERLNLTASSVSRALNNSSHVNENTKQLILKTAAEMNYKQNIMASNLRKGRSQTIGIVVPRINQNFFANVIAGIEEVTYQKGYNLVICQSNELHEKEVKCISALINQHVDCIIVSVAADDGADHSHLQNVIDHNIQLIQFDRVVDELDTFKVVNDNELAAMEAVSHMIGQGYRRIALLEGPQNLGIFQRRNAGYVKALWENKIDLDHDLIIPNSWDREESADRIRALLSSSNPPDAVFASRDDFSALRVLEVANDMGIKVPEQLGICGYSNESFTSITSPSISTVDQHSAEIGKTIAELYFNSISKKDTAEQPKVVSIKPQLIIRPSTAGPANTAT